MSEFIKGSIFNLFYNSTRRGAGKCQTQSYVTAEHFLIWFLRLLHSVDLPVVCMNSFS